MENDVMDIVECDPFNVLRERDRSVVKANTIITDVCCDLTLQQQKIICYLLAQIQPGDDPNQFYEFNLIKFCETCGIGVSGKNYNNVKHEILQLQSKSKWVRIDDNTESLISWVNKAKINHGSGILFIRLDEDLHPYLFNLKQKYTKYELVWVLRFRSKYSLKLYELAKSIHFQEVVPYSRRFKISDLRRILGVADGKLTNWTHFRQRCLDPAVAEINAYSDKLVAYETHRVGHGDIAAITLTVTSRPTMEREQLRYDNNKALGFDPDQLKWW